MVHIDEKNKKVTIDLHTLDVADRTWFNILLDNYIKVCEKNGYLTIENDDLKRQIERKNKRQKNDIRLDLTQMEINPN